MILDKIVDKRKEQLEREKRQTSLADLKIMVRECDKPVISFSKAVKKDTLSVISEVKKASPSKGLICPDFHPVDIAKAYESAGANAVSCLTEEYYFQGSSDFFKSIRNEISLPMIRKDFIFDEYQIWEAKTLGANAILLISAILSPNQMTEFSELAHSLDLECLVEVHNEEEYEKTLGFTPDMLGINNRNLYTFDVDLQTTGRLAKIIGKHNVLVSESGIKNNDDMKTVRSLGADAVLIGETLMRSGNIKETLSELRKGV